jgi:zinc protease
LKNFTRISGFLLLALVAGAGAADDGPTRVDIPYETFRLENGLTVLVHSDHAVPTVFVGMWYAVGSKDEPDGRTGFAHLFEHLMFQGTENRSGEYFSPFTEAGATDMNGTTSEDRTNYYSTVPTGALDMALWMESDRMSYLLGAVTQEALDEQRGVVKNEKRQGETRPYALMADRIREGIYPPGHPYRHSVIGSMTDLDAATVDDVKDWFRTYYGASNVVLVLAGDISVESAKEKVTRYFASAPAGEPLTYPQTWIPELEGNRTEIMYDEVGQIRIARVWPMPGINDRDAALMYLTSETLAGNKNAPLQRLLVDELELATSVFAAPVAKMLNGEYHLYLDLKPGVEPEVVLPVLDRVLAEYLDAGPDAEQLENAKLAIDMSILGGLERSSSIGTVLAEGFLYSNNPLHVNTELAWIDEASAADVQSAARRWLSRGYYELTVLPFPEFRSTADPVDRSVVPGSSTNDTAIIFPPIADTTLDNGMRLVVAERDSIPLVDVVIRIGSGETAAPRQAHAVADFVSMMADKGTRKFDANELAAARDRLGMAGQLAAGLEDTSYGFRIMRENLGESIAIAEEVLRYPAFPSDELAKLKTQISGYLATLQRAPSSAAGSLFEQAVFGAGSPMDAVWTPQSLDAIDGDKLREFHAAEYAPDNITIYMIGDIDLLTAQAAVAATFGRWQGRSESARRPVGAAPAPAAKIILVDQPGAASSTIVAGQSLPPWDPQTAATLDIMNRIFGGGFESRLNMNLREDKAWSYGYGSGILPTLSGDQLFTMEGQVQTDMTAAAMQEIRKEFAAFASTAPATEVEFERARTNRIRSLPGQFDTNRGFLASIVASDSYGLPYDYAAGRAERYAAVSIADVREQAREHFKPDELVWVIVGDLASIEESVRALGFGPVEVRDAFGMRLR